ncbi:hypothetical protein BV898_11665 [Hypsibius exemplaris]|uniref:Uncharacterized protein n=1 Tax=Hypsibius exemplaris TaxID=2072580 RepID=A0A1W0WFW8_HYPEX|nr:hypothetical protein BV898_11665 [Hypsibius exemplaris]
MGAWPRDGVWCECLSGWLDAATRALIRRERGIQCRKTPRPLHTFLTPSGSSRTAEEYMKSSSIACTSEAYCSGRQSLEDPDAVRAEEEEEEEERAARNVNPSLLGSPKNAYVKIMVPGLTKRRGPGSATRRL